MHETIIEDWRRRLGARVHVVPLGDNVGVTDGRTRDIWLSDTLTLTERNCTQMHEQGHLALKLYETGEPQTDQAIEDTIDEWVASQLIPDWLYQYARDNGRNEQHMCELAGVDELTWRARLRTEAPAATVLNFPAPRRTDDAPEGGVGDA